MAESVEQFLIDLGLQTDKIKRSLKEVFHLIDERDRVESVREDEQEKTRKSLLQYVEEILAKEEEILKVKQKQTEEEKKRKIPGGEGGGGFFGGVGAGVEKLAGGSSFMELAGAVAAGGALFKVGEMAVEGLSEALKGLAEWMKETVEEASNLQNKLRSLDALSSEYGETAISMLDRLEGATQGYLKSHELMGVAQELFAANIGLSVPKIEELLQVTTDYSRLTGNDVPQSINTLVTALRSGRLQMVAQRLDLQASTKALLADTEGMSANAKVRYETTIIMEEMSKQLQRMGGAPPTTLVNAFDKLHNALHKISEDFGLAINKSSSTAEAIEFLTKAMEYLNRIGPALSQTLASIADVGLATIGAAIKETITAIQTFTKVIGGLSKSVGLEALFGKELLDRLSSLKGMLVTIAEVATIVAFQIRTSSMEFRALAAMATTFSSAGRAKIQEATKEEVAKSQKELVERLLSLEDILKPKEEKKKEPGKGPPEPDLLPAELRKLAEARLNTEKAMHNEIAAVQEEAIKRQKDLNDDLYKHHQITLDEYLTRQKKAAEDEYGIQLRKNMALHDLDVQQERAKVGAKAKLDPKLEGALLAEQLKQIDLKSATERQAIEAKFREEIHKLNQQGVIDSEQAAQAREETEIAVSTKIREANAKIREERFAKGEIAPSPYIQARLDDVEKEKQAAIDLAKVKYKYAEDSEKARQLLADETLKAEEEAAVKSAEIERHRVETIHSYQEARYKEAIDLLKSEEKVPGANRNKILSQEIDLTTQRVDQLMRELFHLKKGTDEYEKQKKLLNEMLHSLKGMVDAQLELMEAASQTGAIVSNMFGRFEALKGVATAITTGFSTFDALSQYRKEAAPGMSQSPFAALFQSMKPNELGDIQKDSAERLKEFNIALKGAIGAAGGFVQSFVQAQSGMAGAVGGGFAAAGMAQNIGGMFKAGKGLSFLGGPIAQLAIGAVGAIFGGIIGAAKKHTEEAAKKLSTAFDNVVKALSDGSVQLKDAISQAVDIRKQTVEQLSGRKGGREQLDKLLPGMDQQISQMKQKQKALIESLDKDLTILRAPEAFKSVIKDVDAIITKYKEYSGAVEDTAKAQEFLNLSVQEYVSQQGTSLTKAQETAIQDAIQLNDLYQQRQDILQREATQEYDILTRGILVRQRTVTQQKLSEIEQARQARDLQLDQINKQINLAKIRVDAEKTIFDLSSDRVVLETQLAQMQKDTIMADMGRLAAMAGLVADLKSGRATAEDLSRWISQIGSSLPQQFESQYVKNGRYGYGGYNGEL